jgi:MYXO-CTERM domain-containing protein
MRVFVVQVNANGQTFDSQAYLSSPDSSTNNGFGVAVDQQGHAYVTGVTFSPSFQNTFGACPIPALNVNQQPITGDVFIARLGTGSATPAWDWIRCMGGTNGEDSGNAIALDFNTNVYVGGYSQSTDFPSTTGQYQAANAGVQGTNDAIVIKLDTNGVVGWATYLGSTGSDQANGIAVDGSGLVWLTGSTVSQDFPQVNPLPAIAGGGFHCTDGCFAEDIFISRLSTDGKTLGFSTYIGTNAWDYGHAIAVTPSSVHVAAETTDSTFPVFPPGAAQTTFGGGNDDGVVLKLATTPLLISPTAGTVAPGGSQAFGATGGVTPYAFTLSTNGSGGSVTLNGAYSAGTKGSTTDVVTVTDAAGETASATIAVTANTTALIIAPVNTSVPPRGQAAFTANGGVPPYTFGFVSNASIGNITSSGGYTAGSKGSVTDIVHVLDSVGNTANATVIVGAGVTINPSKPTAAPGGTVNFTASGGSGAGFAWTISQNSSNGGIGATTGVYHAGAGTNSVDTVKVTDSLGNTATVQVSVGAGLAVDPAAPSTTTKGSIAFSAFGGAGGFHWTVVNAPSGGTIDGATGAYTAGTTGNVVDTIKVTDSVGKSASVDIHVGPSLTITPSTTNVVAGDKVQFTAAGGSGLLYAYSITKDESGATIDGQLGAYTSGSNAGTDTVHLTDSLGNTADATVNVAAKPIPPSTIPDGGGVPITGTDGGAFNGVNIGGGASDSCGCHTVGAPVDGAAPRMIAGLALALGLAFRRRRRK